MVYKGVEFEYGASWLRAGPEIIHVKRGGVRVFGQGKNNSPNKKSLILKAKKTSLALVT